MYTVLLILILLLFIPLAWGGNSFAPWVPMKTKDLKRLDAFIKNKGYKKFVDLGCGTGKTVLYTAKNYPEIESYGIEIAPLLYAWCVIRSYLPKRIKNAKFKYQNLYTYPLNNADVIFIFGTPGKINTTLVQKFEKELIPGTLIISYAFEIKQWLPIAIDKPDKTDIPIFVYRIK